MLACASLGRKRSARGQRWPARRPATRRPIEPHELPAAAEKHRAPRGHLGDQARPARPFGRGLHRGRVAALQHGMGDQTRRPRRDQDMPLARPHRQLDPGRAGDFIAPDTRRADHRAGRDLALLRRHGDDPSLCAQPDAGDLRPRLQRRAQSLRRVQHRQRRGPGIHLRLIQVVNGSGQIMCQVGLQAAQPGRIHDLRPDAGRLEIGDLALTGRQPFLGLVEHEGARARVLEVGL